GFTTHEELQANLNLVNSKPIGERLAESSSISPHAIEIVRHEQMIIRLSKMIIDETISITFKEESCVISNLSIDNLKMSQLLSEWIFTKLTPEWLHTFYTPWMSSPVLHGPEFSKLSLLKNHSAVKEFAGFLSHNEWPHSLEEILQTNPYKEAEFLRGLHYFLIQRVLVFGASSNTNTNDNSIAKQTRLEKILASFEGKNYFEILGLNKQARESEIDRCYKDLAKNFHPDKLASQSSDTIKELSRKIFLKITEAYQYLNNEEKRKEYLKTLELGHAEEVLKSESAIEDGLKLLKLNRFRDARKVFEKTLELKGHRTNTIIYLIWALIKEKRKKMEPRKLAERVKPLLEKVQHEDRHSPHYFFIRGMYFELLGEVQKAHQLLRHSLTIDPSFNDARRELTYLKHNYATQKTNILTDDLSVVVSNLFKKKSG
ncbi:MAG: J domain-containing protein, partial [Bdellovibrionales bacterium]